MMIWRKTKSVLNRLFKRGKRKPLQRARWDSRYSSSGFRAKWDIERPPDQLVRFLEERRIEGRALDLGCGPGAATSYIVGHSDFTVALDFSLEAVKQARARMADAEGTGRALVAAAPDLPFASGAFGFIYDRGCLHQFDVETWPRYLLEVQRCLRPGGLVLLLEKRRATEAEFARMLPPDLHAERFDEFDGPLREGKTTPFFEAILARGSQR